jgi:hypothetical protein
MKELPRSWYIVQLCAIETLIYIFAATTKHLPYAFWWDFWRLHFIPVLSICSQDGTPPQSIRQTGLLNIYRYKREELGYRTAFFTAAIGFSNVFGSLFASGILATMEGFLGYAAWRLVRHISMYVVDFDCYQMAVFRRGLFDSFCRDLRDVHTS